MSDITGRDGMIIAEALAFAYAAMKHLPVVFQSPSNMADMRTLLFARLGQKGAEFQIGQAMLTAWNLRADVPSCHIAVWTEKSGGRRGYCRLE